MHASKWVFYLVKIVGAGGFEPPTSRTRTVRSIRAEPRPADNKLYHSHSFLQDESLPPAVAMVRLELTVSIHLPVRLNTIVYGVFSHKRKTIHSDEDYSSLKGITPIMNRA